MKKSQSKRAESPSELTDARIEELGDWRGEMLSRLRALIKQADPDVVEEWKWRGTPVWSHNGIICTGETYKKVVKMTFAKGAMPPLVLTVDDCRAAYDRMRARGVEFTQEPMDRYGTVDAGFRDPSGNGWKMIQARR